MIAPRSLWLACADRKPIVQDDSWEKALEAYSAEMKEAEMRAARAVVEAIGGWPCGADHDLDRWDDARLRKIIEMARREET